MSVLVWYARAVDTDDVAGVDFTVHVDFDIEEKNTVGIYVDADVDVADADNGAVVDI